MTNENLDGSEETDVPSPHSHLSGSIRSTAWCSRRHRRSRMFAHGFSFMANQIPRECRPVNQPLPSPPSSLPSSPPCLPCPHPLGRRHEHLQTLKGSVRQRQEPLLRHDPQGKSLLSVRRLILLLQVDGLTWHQEYSKTMTAAYGSRYKLSS